MADAKKYFSKPGCPASRGEWKPYLSGRMNRQEFLETALNWISDNNPNDYMAKHQHDETAEELWEHFQAVIQWIESIFPEKTRTKDMQKVDWGELHTEFKDAIFDPKKIEEEWNKLMVDDEIVKKAGIYPYLITRDEKWLTLRTFPAGIKRKVYLKQNRKCAHCGEEFEEKDMDADHIDPWSKGGKTIEENCQILCKSCNRRKSDK